MVQLEEFTRRLSQGFDQVKQFAAEKIGMAEDITEFPPAFRQLDEVAVLRSLPTDTGCCRRSSRSRSCLMGCTRPLTS